MLRWLLRWTTGASFILITALSSTAQTSPDTTTTPLTSPDSVAASASSPAPEASGAAGPGAVALTVGDLARLAELFERTEQPFLGYAFRLAHYELEPDSAARLASGTAALNGAYFAGRTAEAEVALRKLAADFPSLRRTFRWQYAVLLAQDARWQEASIALDGAALTPADDDSLRQRLPVMQALLALHASDAEVALAALEPVDTSEPFGSAGAPLAVASARVALREGPPEAARSPLLAGALSAVVPGAGQLYTGHVYDAAQAFGFTATLGYGAYSAWRYELDAGGPTAYVLPSIATLVAGAFYLANVRGAHASAARFNAYREARFYRQAIESLNVVVRDDGWMLGVRLTP